ncbi:hypothetical protein OZN62_07545 [Aurantiacibacter sp. MUD11]|uniref:CC_3452 family protein n=1 Tax=Aurantiacibacter sp. MUD11 TaxID=3003265 RepID=UPI0022AB31A5|nr:hypothetical protein [Aurantiacibacter sp. MUD11]WAT16799.1 hypothetical protein OZN62_07545 [Aurantiacibacter sp. MUD11]
MFARATTRIATSALAASIALAGALAPAALQARSNPVYFTAELAAPASEERVIAGGVVFRCEGTTCTAPRGSERPLRVCSELRREVGAITSFAAGREDLSASRLGRCNG